MAMWFFWYAAKRHIQRSRSLGLGAAHCEVGIRWEHYNVGHQLLAGMACAHMAIEMRSHSNTGRWYVYISVILVGREIEVLMRKWMFEGSTDWLFDVPVFPRISWQTLTPCRKQTNLRTLQQSENSDRVSFTRNRKTPAALVCLGFTHTQSTAQYWVGQSRLDMRFSVVIYSYIQSYHCLFAAMPLRIIRWHVMPWSKL